MTKTNIALTILMALGLAACGSSGNSSDNKQIQPTPTEVGAGKTSNGTTQAQGSQPTTASESPTPNTGSTPSSNDTSASAPNDGNTPSSNNTSASTPNGENTPSSNDTSVSTPNGGNTPSSNNTSASTPNGGNTPSSDDTSASAPNGGNTPSSDDTSASAPNGGNTPSSNDTSSSVPNDDKGNTIEELQPEKNAYAQSTATVGGGFIIPKNAVEIESANLSSQDTQLTKFINVENKKIPIVYDALNGNSVNIQDATRKLLVQKGTNTLIFFVEQNDLEKRYLSTSGINKTKEMPKEGVLTYKGQSFNYYDGNNNLALDTIDIGSAEFTVDFKDKILTGTLKSPVENTTFVPVEITAAVTQNTFAGAKNGVSVQGGFFGENAAELIGDYIREGEQQNAIGVFRAEKSE